jgi:hypothetical protein
MPIKIPKKIIALAVIFAVLVGVLLLADPNNLPSVALVIPFILLFTLLYISVSAFFNIARNWHGWAKPLHVVRPRIAASLISGFVVFLLILQSIGQLSIRDVLTVGLICIIAYVYASKFSIASPGA